MTTHQTPGSPGPGVDASGRPVIDPTKNVEDTLKAAIRRIDDVSALNNRYVLDSLKNIRNEMKLRDEHNAEIRKLTGKNNKSTRLIDLGNADAKAASLQTAVQALATQLATSNVAADKRVADLAVTLATAKSVSDAQTNAQIAELQKASYTGAGKGGGQAAMIGWIFGGIAIVIAALSFIVPHLK